MKLIKNTKDEKRILVKFEPFDSGAQVAYHIGLIRHPCGLMNFGYSPFLLFDGGSDWKHTDRDNVQRWSTPQERLSVSQTIVSLVETELVPLLDINDIVVRGPLSYEKMTSVRYIKITDAFYRNGFDYWTILYCDNGDNYWFHTRDNQTLPLDKYPKGWIKKSHLRNNQVHVIYDQREIERDEAIQNHQRSHDTS